MILTCPECATSYFVDDSRVPEAGRKVKCAECGHRWMAMREPPPPSTGGLDDLDIIAVDPAPTAEAEAPATETGDVAEAAPEAIVEPAVVAAELGPLPGRRRPQPTRRPAKRSNAVVWAGVGGLFVALATCAVVFREQAVRLWPASSAAYEALGLAVDGGGLVIERVRVEPSFQAGQAVLSVTGSIRNVRSSPVEAPPMRVTLLNRAGKPVAATIARPVDPTVPPHALRHFVIAISDPPVTARDLEVRFATGREAKAHGEAPPHTGAPTQPATAEPLAPGPGTEHG